MDLKEKFNSALDKAVSKTGAKKDREVYDEDKMRRQVMNFIEGQAPNKTKQEVEMEANQFLTRLEHIVDEAKHTGRMEERMKGEGSDAVYNMLLLNVGANVVLVAMFVWIHFV